MKFSVSLFIVSCISFFLQLNAQEGVLNNYEYIFPPNGANNVQNHSTIILRFNNISPQELSNLQSLFSVNGELSGPHEGITKIASDKRTVIFRPLKAFDAGEKVKVKITPEVSDNEKNIDELLFDFTVSSQTLDENSSRPVFQTNAKKLQMNPGQSQVRTFPNGITVPSDFPKVRIENKTLPSDDYIFLNTRQAPYYNIIFNPEGEPVWYSKTPDRRDDFKVQANNWITMLVGDGYGGNGPGFIAFNQDFEFIKSMRAVNDYVTDDHDLIVLPDSGYILIGQKEVKVDMSEYVSGGRTDATVSETCIQEFTAEDEMIFIWRAWDHFDIGDLELENLNSSYIRFPHINALAIDEDGQLLISSRHLSEISKIDRQTGAFIWRWNGIPDSENNDFHFERDLFDGFRNQHAISSLGNQRYLLYDNGNLHSPPTSRAVEYELDIENMTASLVWEFNNPFERGFSSQMGNTQRMSNGNTHINWSYGDLFPIATEVRPEGDVVFELWFEGGERCYRSFRFPWEGKTRVPSLILEPQVNKLGLIFNKFGDNDVQSFNIYGDTLPNPNNLIINTVETYTELDDLESGKRYFFRVTAVDSEGSEGDYSNEEDIWISQSSAGENLILNGNFDASIDPWIFEKEDLVAAEVSVPDSICKISIQDGGGSYGDIRLSQKNIQLIHGQKYILEYTAWSEETRAIEVLLHKDRSIASDYSQFGFVALSNEKKKHSHEFLMEHSSDLSACLSFKVGASNANVYIDSVRLSYGNPLQMNHPTLLPSFMLAQNYPNPFKLSTQISYSISEECKVRITISNSLGQIVKEVVHNAKSAGSHIERFEPKNLARGIYFYSVELCALNSGKYFVQTKRMVFID